MAVEKVRSFKYLGLELTVDGRCDKDVKIQVAIIIGKGGFHKKKGAS